MPPETDWSAIEDRAYDAAAGEFLLLDGSEPDDVAIDDLVGLTRAESPLGTVQRLVEVIPDRFEYRAGVTYVGSTVGDLLAAGAGVCQDFAHLALLLLRRHGIGARYVSGYLWAPSEDEASAEVETHAWVEALLPGADGPAWVGLDPTNRTLGGESPRQDRPRPPLRRRAADQGRLPRDGGLGAERLGADDARRRVTLSRLRWVTI